MIHEITGQPGHGKTLYALTLARAFAKEGRVVYAHGVTNIDYGKTGFLQLDDPKAWEALPDNSVVLVDECYSAFPNRNMASATPPYIEALARHRHRGFDFLLVHQQPNQVDPFVRGLVDRHTHVRRKFGMQAAVLKEFDHSAPNPLKDEPLRKPLWRYPKDVFGLYTSATMHTYKRRIPWYVYAMIPLLAYVIWAFWRVTHKPMVGQQFTAAAAAEGAPAQAGVAAAVAGGGPPADYDRWMRPRQGGIPWTAEAYSYLRPNGKPELYCIVSSAGTNAQGDYGAGGCTCLTEQGTRAEVAPQDCERYAIDGLYNPFRDRQTERTEVARAATPLASDRPEAASAPAAVAGVTTTEPVASYGGFRQ